MHAVDPGPFHCVPRRPFPTACLLLQRRAFHYIGVPNREPGAAAGSVLDSYRMVLGELDVPRGVELALEGAHRGDVRRIELPPDLGFATSEWRLEGRVRVRLPLTLTPTLTLTLPLPLPVINP